MNPSTRNHRSPDHILLRVLDLACAIQQIPAPTFHERQRAEWIRQQFEAGGLADVEIDDTGNVYARIPGRGDARPLVISAHLDTVFPLDTDLHLIRSAEHIAGPGIGDNSVGLAGLMSLAWLLHARPAHPRGDIWLVANVGEEGLGDLKGMQAVVDRFGDRPIGYLVLEGMGLGEVFHRGLGVQRYRITVRTNGGHSWLDYGRPSAIHELACLINHLTSLPIPKEPRSTMNVGMISGGTSINTIASRASLELDLRSISVATLTTMSDEVICAVKAANRPGIRCQVEVIGQRPAGEIPLRHPLVQLADRSLRRIGFSPVFGVGSTDANIPLSRGYPAICIGLTTGTGAHTTDEFIRTPPLAKGLEHLYHIVTHVWDEV